MLAVRQRNNSALPLKSWIYKVSSKTFRSLTGPYLKPLFKPFRKGLNKYLKRITYKHSLASRPIKNSYYRLYSSTPAPAKCDNNIKTTTTPRIFKDI